MGEFLGFCLLAYALFGIVFILSIGSRVTNLSNKFVKGDIVLAVIFLPFTLVIVGVAFLLYLMAIIEDRIKLTSLVNWWKSPIGNKD